MKLAHKTALYFVPLAVVLCAPAYATVTITGFSPSKASPQPLGSTIVWHAQATDTGTGPITFQFNVGIPNQGIAVVKDFNIGTFKNGTYTSQGFSWVPTGVEGTYKVEVVIKDFGTGETANKIINYTINPLSTGGQPKVVGTANPLVALFGAPSCVAGSTMYVNFQQQGSSTVTSTNSQTCHPPATMNFEVAGMYPSTTYTMYAVTDTAGNLTNGPSVTFTTRALPPPTTVPFPAVNVLTAPQSGADTAEDVLLFNPIQFGAGPIYPSMATDLAGKTIWYYATNPAQSIVLTRPLPNATMLTIQSGPAWNINSDNQQYLRQIDLAGNIVKETNTGVIQQELLALGATDGGPCTAIAKPAPIGAGCLDGFHHDAIQTLPNGYTAVLVSIEKICAAGTQGDTSGLPVDVVGDMVLVLNYNWQVVWYFDTFEHDGGAPQLDITRAAVLGETCTPGQQGCPAMLLMGTGISPSGKDWLHCNALYYWPQDKDIVLSSRNQDWIMKVDYNNGAGTGDIKWRLGPCGDFTFDNIYHDPWPWNSAQHDVGIENGGAGPLTLFDNGDTRVSPASGPGSSSGCIKGVGSGNSRGMALTINETALTVTPVLSADLGYYSTADGSAQLLPNGNYFYVPAIVLVSLSTEDSYNIEIQPTSGTDTGTTVMNLQTTDVYRSWRMSSMYTPPTT